MINRAWITPIIILLLVEDSLAMMVIHFLQFMIDLSWFRRGNLPGIHPMIVKMMFMRNWPPNPRTIRTGTGGKRMANTMRKKVPSALIVLILYFGVKVVVDIGCLLVGVVDFNVRKIFCLTKL